jgi:hypothetical protein
MHLEKDKFPKSISAEASGMLLNWRLDQIVDAICNIQSGFSISSEIQIDFRFF